MLYMGVGSLVWFAAALLLDQSGLDRRFSAFWGFRLSGFGVKGFGDLGV